MPFTIEIEREIDGRWIAAVPELPGVIVYGNTEDEVTQKVITLSLRVIADRLEHGEIVPTETGEIIPMQISFATAS